MKRLLVSLYLFCCSSIAFAIVSLQLESPQVQMGENFTLNLRVEGTQINAVPDLTPLQRDFTIVGTESNINYNIINGKVRAVSEWSVILTPKRGGVLPIPSLTVGQEKTNPISIEITSSSPTAQSNTIKSGASLQQQQQQDVLLLTEVSEGKPYVNQQVIYTVKLFNSSRLLDANYLPPQVEDALFVPFGDGRRYQITQNGRLYAVEEQQFALFPQKSGDLTIKPPAFNALVYDLGGPRRVKVEAQPTTLKVQPIPAQYKDKNWLPAKQVTLSENYDQNTTSLLEGSTLERTVILRAVAVPAQLLPPLDFGHSDQFSIYPEKPTTSNSFKQQDLIGTATVKVTYLLNKAGKITIPALTLPWFNTVTRKVELSSLPERTVEVVASVAQNKLMNNAQAASTPAQPITKPAATSVSPVSESNLMGTRSAKINIAWWVAGGFALAWLFTMFIWYQQRSKPFLAHQNKTQILQKLQEACLNNHPGKARDALLSWGRLQWPEANLLNLIDLENLISDPAFKQQINQLSQALYQDAKPKEWRGELLWQCVTNFKGSTATVKEKAGNLPPINRL